MKFSNSRFSTVLVYYGLALSAGSFGAVHLSTFLSGLVEIPANGVCALCLHYAGRRIPNATALLIGGILCLMLIPILVFEPGKIFYRTYVIYYGSQAAIFVIVYTVINQCCLRIIARITRFNLKLCSMLILICYTV